MIFIKVFPNGELIWELAKRDVRDRYASNTLGMLWLLIQPVVTIIIYLSVFSIIFKMRIPESANTEGSYPLYFLSGFVCWMALSEAMSRAPSLISNNAALVKQIVFPTQVLPTKSALAVSLLQLIFLSFLICYSFFDAGATVMIFGLLVACPLLLLFNIGMTSLFSAIGVFVKDVGDLIGLILTGGLFLTPVFYAPGTVTGGLAKVIAYNPFSYPIYCFQDILFYQRITRPEAWIIFVILSLSLCFFGQYTFRKVKHLFGDAI